VNHLRARVLKPWATNPASSGGVVTVHTRSIRNRRFQIHDHAAFIKFPAWAITDTAVSRNALVVLAGICSRLDHDDPLRPVMATYDMLAELVAMNMTTISAAINELETARIITVTRRRGGKDHNLPNLYRIHWTNPHPTNTGPANTGPANTGQARVSANPETVEARVSASENRTYFSEPSPPTDQHTNKAPAQVMGEGHQNQPLKLLTAKLNTTDTNRLHNGPGLRTLTRRLAERVRQGWTPTQLVGAIAERDLSTANNIAAVLITRTNDLGPPPATIAANRARCQQDAHIRRLKVWAAVGDSHARTELDRLTGVDQ